MKRNQQIVMESGSGHRSVGTVISLHRDGTASVKAPRGSSFEWALAKDDGTVEPNPYYKPVFPVGIWREFEEGETEFTIQEYNQKLADRRMAEYRERATSDKIRGIEELQESKRLFLNTWHEQVVSSGPYRFRVIDGMRGEGMSEEIVSIFVSEEEQREPKGWHNLVEVDIQYYFHNGRSLGSGAGSSTGVGRTYEEAFQNAVLKSI